MLKEIKVICISSFLVHSSDGKVLDGEFFEGNEYTATLDEEVEEYYINNNGCYEYPVAHYKYDELIMDEDFKLVD